MKIKVNVFDLKNKSDISVYEKFLNSDVKIIREIPVDGSLVVVYEVSEELPPSK